MASSKMLSLWRKIGPGLITGASGDDPSEIGTYSHAGASYGLKTLWTALFIAAMTIGIFATAQTFTLKSKEIGGRATNRKMISIF